MSDVQLSRIKEVSYSSLKGEEEVREQEKKRTAHYLTVDLFL